MSVSAFLCRLVVVEDNAECTADPFPLAAFSFLCLSVVQGAVQADVGILVISARKGEFETGFDRGGQTREHALLAKTLGVR